MPGAVIQVDGCNGEMEACNNPSEVPRARIDRQSGDDSLLWLDPRFCSALADPKIGRNRRIGGAMSRAVKEGGSDEVCERIARAMVSSFRSLIF